MIIPKPLPKHGYREWQVTTAPTVEPVTLDELKVFARIDGTDEDTYLTGLLLSIREAVEEYLGRALLLQTLTLAMDYWPGAVIELPRPKLIAITSINTLDEDGVTTLYASSNYYIDVFAEPGKLIIKQGATWPSTTARLHGGYKIIFTAGYGTLAASIPGPIKEAIKFWATWVYENRIPVVKPPALAMTLLNPFRIQNI